MTFWTRLEKLPIYSLLDGFSDLKAKVLFQAQVSLPRCGTVSFISEAGGQPPPAFLCGAPRLAFHPDRGYRGAPRYSPETNRRKLNRVCVVLLLLVRGQSNALHCLA